ncbi:MAG TPA: hypothetical protein VLA89_07305, partial [Gemmatimonadales bacterium]|nr:hypothetical protein [Gemmatimonadales bacterium]
MRFLLRIALAGAAVIACNPDQPPGPSSIEDQVTADAFGPGPTQYVTVPVQVASAFATAPFNVTRSLTIPTGFSIKVFARVSGARFLAVTPDGRTLVSRPGSGSITLLRPNGTGAPLSSNFVTGLQRPHDMVFYKSGTTMYLYVSEKNRISRAVYVNGDLTMRSRQVVVSGLPDASSPLLG